MQQIHPYIKYIDQQLHIEQVPVSAIAAKYGTPCYVYSKASITANWQAFFCCENRDNDSDGVICNVPVSDRNVQAPDRIFYAVKANSNLAILKLLAELGAGFDTVSQGEIKRVIKATGTAKHVVFSGVGKTRAEIEFALQAGIYCFNVESAAELAVINAIAGELGVKAPIALRVNPNIDAKTHPYIATGLKENKFGINHADIEQLYLVAANMPGIEVLGLCCHIGSQITDLQPFLAAMRQMLALAEVISRHGYKLKHINLGGGLGIRYQHEQPPTPQQYIAAVRAEMDAALVAQAETQNKHFGAQTVTQQPYALHIEPGRAIVGNSGMLITKVEYVKSTQLIKTAAINKNFVIVDAGMNDLMRPALYGSKHEVIPVKQAMSMETMSEKMKTTGEVMQASNLYAIASNSAHGAVRGDDAQEKIVTCDIVGPVCETADCFARDVQLYAAAGDLLAITNAGAYGFSMSSNYNTRARCAEVLVEGDKFYLIRKRETIEELYQYEIVL